MMTARTEVTNPPDFLSVSEAAAVLRIGRTCGYALAREFIRTDGASGLAVVKVGRQLRVPRVALEDLLGGAITWPINEVTVDEPTTPTRTPRARRTKPEQSARLFSA